MSHRAKVCSALHFLIVAADSLCSPRATGVRTTTASSSAAPVCARVMSSRTPPGAHPDSPVMPLRADIAFGPERHRPGSPAIRQATGPTSPSACQRRFRTSVTSNEPTSPNRARLAIPRTRDEPCAGDCRTGDCDSPSPFFWTGAMPLNAHEPRLPQSPQASPAPPRLYFPRRKTPEALAIVPTVQPLWQTGCHRRPVACRYARGCRLPSMAHEYLAGGCQRGHRR